MRICPDLVEGSQLREHFQLDRPNIRLDFDSICDRTDSWFLLTSLYSKVQLKGQMIYLKPAEVVLFLASPWIDQIAIPKNANSNLKNVLFNDPIADTSALSQSNSDLLSDSQMLLEKLNQHRVALQEIRERYALVVQGANDGIWEWNLKTDEVYFSNRWKSMLGYEENDLENHLDEWFSRIHPNDRKWVEVKISEHLEGLTSHLESEYRMRHQDGTYRWMLSRGVGIRDENGCAIRMAGSQTDINEQKQAEEKLLHDAFHDVLTGLPNRALLMEHLQHAIQLAKRNENYLFAVLFLDIDRFKAINDSLGFEIGDRLLMAIAQRLTCTLHSSDTIARLGGDEFAVLLENMKDIQFAAAIAEKIQQQLARPFILDDHEVFTNVSIGIALSANGYERAEDLLRDADTAMYQAKAQGTGHYKIFQHSMHSLVVARLQLENDLRHALDRQELELYYQPIVSLRALKIKGFEVLIRWRHPDRGIISPSKFIPVAEETGLIVPIGWWILKQACHQLRKWHQQFPLRSPLTISVNLSAKQFSTQMVEQINQILQETQMESRYLKLEITESLLLENAPFTTTMLKKLKKLGVQISLDDFGTGYSSLSYLHQFPIDILKIDRSFINKIDTDIEQLAIVRAIVSLAWNLSLEVIAEGVETAKHLAQLRALKCRYGQGYLFSQPTNSAVATQLLAAGTQALKNRISHSI